jgi:tRNA modification GTPase
LQRAEYALGTCIDAIQSRNVPLSILSTDIRDALAALDEIVGKTFNEDILGRIFSKFCIGK